MQKLGTGKFEGYGISIVHDRGIHFEGVFGFFGAIIIGIELLHIITIVKRKMNILGNANADPVVDSEIGTIVGAFQAYHDRCE